jgi:hypothetical protein
MRLIGTAERGLAHMVSRVQSRTAFGKKLSQFDTVLQVKLPTSPVLGGGGGPAPPPPPPPPRTPASTPYFPSSNNNNIHKH